VQEQLSLEFLPNRIALLLFCFYDLQGKVVLNVSSNGDSNFCHRLKKMALLLESVSRAWGEVRKKVLVSKLSVSRPPSFQTLEVLFTCQESL